MAETHEVIGHMCKTLLDAARVFNQYGRYHMAKTPPDQEKAAINGALAEQCIEAAYEGMDFLRENIT